MAHSAIAAYVQRVVDEAPPLSDEQRSTLATLLARHEAIISEPMVVALDG